MMNFLCRNGIHKSDYPVKGQEYYIFELRGKTVRCIRCNREGYYDNYGVYLHWKKLA